MKILNHLDSKIRKKTVFLDMDKTLIYSTYVPQTAYDFSVTTSHWQKHYVMKRPGVHDFLSKVSKMYEVVAFTAASEDYASRVLDLLDPEGRISHRLYRDSCTLVSGEWVKDLSKTERDLKRVVIVDDKESSYSLHPENGILISPFVGDVEDNELEKMGEFLVWCYKFEDMRYGAMLYPFWIRSIWDYDTTRKRTYRD